MAVGGQATSVEQLKRLEGEAGGDWNSLLQLGTARDIGAQIVQDCSTRKDSNTPRQIYYAA